MASGRSRRTSLDGCRTTPFVPGKPARSSSSARRPLRRSARVCGASKPRLMHKSRASREETCRRFDAAVVSPCSASGHAQRPELHCMPHT